MSLEVVNAFELYDSARRAWRKAEFMATEMAVERMGGVVIHHSAITVDSTRVAPDGRLRAQTADSPVESKS
jgi:hypothetical protein